MSTLEKLFVQVFERKKWIVDQVKQQSDLFDQSLASNALINGFQPPSWLLSSRFDVGSADLKELKKEDLISGLLFPHPRPNYPYTAGHNKFLCKPLFSESNIQSASEKDYVNVGGSSMRAPELHLNQGITSDLHRTEARLSDAKSQLDTLQSRSRRRVSCDISRLCFETDEFLDARDSSMLVPMCHTNEAISSPPQTGAGFCETGSQPDKSRARMQRSRSRQKALELRKGKSADAKTGKEPGQIYISGFTGTITRSKVSGGLPTDARDLLEQCTVSDTTNEGSRRVTRHESHTFHADFADKQLQSPNFVAEVQNIPGSQALFRSPMSEEKDNLIRQNREDCNVSNITNEASCRVTRDGSETFHANFADKPLQSPMFVDEVDILQTIPGNLVLSRSHMSEEKDNLDRANREERKVSDTTYEARCRVTQHGSDTFDATSADKPLQSSNFVDEEDMLQNIPGNQALSRSPMSEEKDNLDRANREERKVLDITNEARCRVTQHGSGTFHATSADKPLQSSSFVDEEDMLQNNPGSQPLARSPMSEEKDILIGANREEHNVLNTMNEASCRVTRHGSNTFRANSANIPLQSSNFVDEEDMLQNIPGSQALSRSPMSEEKDNLIGANREEHNVLNTMNEASCRVTRHGSNTFNANYADKPLQSPNFVEDEDMLQNTPGSQAHSRSPMSEERDNLIGANEEERNVPNLANEATCRVTPHGSDILHANSANKPLHFPNFVDEEDMLQKIPGSEALSRSLMSDEKDNLIRANIEEHPSKFETTDKCCGRSQTVSVNCAEGLQKLGSSEPVASGGVLPSKPLSSNKYSTSGTRSNLFEAHDLLKASDTQLLAVLGTGGTEATRLGRFSVGVADKGVVSELPVEAFSKGLRSNMVSSFVVAESRPSHDDSMVMEPKQLSFNEVEDCISNGRFAPRTTNENGNGSPDRDRMLGPTEPLRKDTLCKTGSYGLSPRLQDKEGDIDVEGTEKGTNFSTEFEQTREAPSQDFSLNEEERESAQDCPPGSVDISISMLTTEDVKGDIDMEDAEKDINFSTELKQTWEEPSTCISLNEEEHENAQDFPPGSVNISVSMLTTEDQDFAFAESELNSEIMGKVDAMDENLQDTESVIGDWLLSYSSVRSFNFGDLDISAPKSMPELEGFHIDLAAEKRLSLPADKISLGSIDLPSGRNEQTSAFEKVCRYSTMITPLKESSEHKNHNNSDVYHSLRNELQESMDLENTVPFSDENFKQLEGSCTLTREPSCMPLSLARLDWNIGKPPCTPPVKMLGQKISPLPADHSFEKHKMVNPELTCFRIDEDICTSEENGTLDEVGDILRECDDSRYSNSSSHRRPLVNMTDTKTWKSTSVPKDVNERDSIASVNGEPYMLRAQTDAKLKLRNTYGNDRGSKNDKENQNSTIGVNGVEKVSKTHFSMEPRLLRKTSQENRLPSFLGKGGKRANIVSNVSSFIPLVQQKQQTTTFAAGKRDVKVKALEAAEAAKRLEEKRDRDRKMKKEVAKLKRARLEEEKTKQLELKQRKEAEDQKKKEADMVSKKRLREEQDRKDKERKRKCVEEARKEQKEQPKLRAEKEEREQRRRAADVKLDKKKHLRNEEPKHHKPEKNSQIADVREKIKTGVKTAQDASETAMNVSQVHEDPEGSKEYDDQVASNLCDADASTCLFTLSEGSGEQSYDISPYQASDDDEEEEHVIPKKKFIPSWAREKSLMSIMPFMERVDPYGIFPPTHVCNISQFFHK